MQFVIATANPGKVREMREILSELGIDAVTRKELGIELEIEETGSTFLDNATLKARAICEASGMPSIADDSGLLVDALGGAPGVYSSSYGGPGLSDAQRCDYLLEKLKNKEQKSAKFVSTIVCAFPGGDILAAEGECHGEIIGSQRGFNGFGYDPVFLVRGKDRTMAELAPDEKNIISHRGVALREFSKKLQALLMRKSESGAF